MTENQQKLAIEITAYIESLKEKFKNKQELTFDETEKLGLAFKLDEDYESLSDSRFDYFNFHDLYVTYHEDLSFNGVYFKKNHSKKFSDVINLDDFKKINEQEYNPENSVKLRQLFLDHGLLIEIQKNEVEDHKSTLILIAKKWGRICIDEKISDEKLKLIAKETRDTLRKKNIETFIDSTLTDETSDTFKGLLKTYYVYNESIKILQKISTQQEQTTFHIPPINFELHFSSITHIVNRHYGHILSSSNIQSKTFHTPKLEPQNINLLLSKLEEAIKQGKTEISIHLGKAFLFEFSGDIYALYIQEYKHDKSKIIVDTLFIVDEQNDKAKHLKEQIQNSEVISLSNDIKILKEK